MFQTTNQSNHVKSTFFWVQFRVSSGFFPFFRPDSPQNAQRLGQDPAWAPAAEKWGSNSENGPRFPAELDELGNTRGIERHPGFFMVWSL